MGKAVLIAAWIAISTAAAIVVNLVTSGGGWWLWLVLGLPDNAEGSPPSRLRRISGASIPPFAQTVLWVLDVLNPRLEESPDGPVLLT
jgi:hypothetical protein